MFHDAEVGDDSIEVLATSGEVLAGLMEMRLQAVARVKTMGIDAGAEKLHALVDFAAVALFRVESHLQVVFQITLDYGDVLFGFLVLLGRNHVEEVVDIAAVVFVAEIVGDEAVELVEVDIGHELRSEVADNDTASGWLLIEGFFRREDGRIPVARVAAFPGFFDGVVENDLAPEVVAGEI